MSTSEETLMSVIEVLREAVDSAIHAMDSDEEIDIGGNSYSSNEAGGYLLSLVDEVNKVLPPTLQIEVPE